MEVSARYSVMPSEFYIPDGKYITKQNSDNKQGRGRYAFTKTRAR